MTRLLLFALMILVERLSEYFFMAVVRTHPRDSVVGSEPEP